MRPAVSARKIAEIRARVERIRQLLPTDVDAFLSRRTEAEALIFNLFLALQESSDLAMHLVAERGLGVPGDTRAAFDALEKAGHLDLSLSKRLATAVGLRNRIAHEYGSLDLVKVYEAARDDLGDLLAFAKAAAEMSGLTG